MKMTTTIPDLASDPALAAVSQETLQSLQAAGWRPIYSPFCRAWWFRQDARGWVTSLYADPNKAIAAAGSVEERARSVLAERERKGARE